MIKFYGKTVYSLFLFLLFVVSPTENKTPFYNSKTKHCIYVAITLQFLVYLNAEKCKSKFSMMMN